MGHAVDKDLLLLLQYEVRDLVKECNAIKLQMIQHHERLRAMEEKLREAAAENGSKEIKKVLERLLSFEGQISIRLQTLEEKFDQLEQTHTMTANEVELLKHSYTRTADEVKLLKHSHTKTADEVELLKHSHTKTADEVELLKHSHTKVADEVELLKHSHTKRADEVELLKHSHTKTADEVELLTHSHTKTVDEVELLKHSHTCLLYTSPSPRDGLLSRMPSSA